jgi:hypothetical protein
MSKPTAENLIAAEVERQRAMWGESNERADASQGELMHAAMAQLDALYDKQAGIGDAFDAPPAVYPLSWGGFRDYGSDIANLVVAVAFLTNEIARKLRAGEDYTRKSRNPDTQPYTADQPAAV